MKILILTDGITPFAKGGMQRHSQLMVEYLARLGHTLTIYHCVEPNLKGQVDPAEAFSELALPNIQLVTFDYSDNGKLPGHYLRAQKKLATSYFEHLKKSDETFDFIYTKGFVGWTLLKQRQLLKWKAPISVKFHGMNMFQAQASFKLELQKHLLIPSVKWIMNRSDVVFSYGGKITEIIKSQTDTPVVEVPTGIEKTWLVKELPERSGSLKLLFVGRFDRVKGLPELYEALEMFAEKYDNWECHFVGPIPPDQQLKLKQCIYHGAIYVQEELKAIYDKCDVLLNTSISEGMPNVVLEAMARGLAIIATDVGATCTLVSNGENGYLIARPEPMLILNQLIALHDLSREQLNSIQKASSQKLKVFLWDEIGPKLARAIEGLS